MGIRRDTPSDVSPDSAPVNHEQAHASDEPSPPSERTYTQAEVDSLAANIRRKYESLARENRKPTPTPDPTANEPVSKHELLQELESLRLGRAFDRAVAPLALRDAQRDALETLFKAEHPEDAAHWAQSKVADLGWQSKDAGDPPKPQPVTPPVTFGAPAPKASWDRTLNPNEWTADDIERIYSEKGLADGRKFITERAERWLRNARIVPPRKG